MPPDVVLLDLGLPDLDGIDVLRRKLETHPANPRHLITEPGMGHRFEEWSPYGPVPARRAQNDRNP